MRNIPDKVNLRAFCIEKAIDVYNVDADQSIIATAQAFEEYITEGIDLPDHAHYPDIFLTINNNMCPFEEEEDEGIGFN